MSEAQLPWGPAHPIANERIKLVPFDSDKHGVEYHRLSLPHPEIYRYTPLGPFDTNEEFTAELNRWLKPSETYMYAIIDKTRPATAQDDEGALAGTIAYIRMSAHNLAAEIGVVIILPGFQRTHVATNAAGLMLQNGFAPVSEGGLGLRRITWEAHTENIGSRKLAERVGFRQDALFRFYRFIRDGVRMGKIGNGRPLPPGSAEGDVWRDSVLLSVCWDEWAEGIEEKVRLAMQRGA